MAVRQQRGAERGIIFVDMEEEREKGTVSGRYVYTGDMNEANDVLDLNPTAFVDDVYNAVRGVLISFNAPFALFNWSFDISFLDFC